MKRNNRSLLSKEPMTLVTVSLALSGSVFAGGAYDQLGVAGSASGPDATTVCAEGHTGCTHDHSNDHASGWTSTPELTLGGFTLTPQLHANGVYGTTTASEPGELAVGSHDPSKDEAWQWQGIEPGLSLRSDWLDGFATGVWIPDEDEFELEEAFLTLKELPFLPSGLSIRGGQYLNRIGFHNTTHLHAWSTVDAPLASALFLGEEGLATVGGELTWETPGRWPAFFSVSYGEAREHAHAHGHGEEEGHSDHEEEEDHHDEEEHHDDEHDEHGDEHDEHGEEEIAFAGDVLSIGVLVPFDYNDFHRYRFSAGAALGETEEGDTLSVYQLGTEYAWHTASYGQWGRSLTWRTEVFLRDAEESGQDLGLSTQLLAAITPELDAVLRYGWVEGPEERSRTSAGITFRPLGSDLLQFRVQYNYDDLDHGDEHSVWLQTGFNWGGAEVR